MGLNILRRILPILLLQSLFFNATSQQISIIPTADQGYIILDKENASLKVIDADGNVKYRFGGWGLDDEYSFDKAVHLYTQSGLKIFITDAGQKNVKAFDKRLQPIAIYNVQEITPIASKLIDGEQLLVLDKSMQEWQLINSRFNSKQSITIDIPESITIDQNKAPLLLNSLVLIPIVPSAKKITTADSVNSYNYICYNYLGIFKNWLNLPERITTYADSMQPMVLVSDNQIYRVNLASSTQSFKVATVHNEEKIVWVSATEYGFLKEQKMVIKPLPAVPTD